MNIGEISKPSVDRTQVDKKLKVDQPDPVLKTQVTSDLVKLSEESQKRYEQEHNKQGDGDDQVKAKTDADQQEKTETETNEHPPIIDVRV